MDTAYVIETHELTKCYRDVTAVDQLNLRVLPGCITGFLGRNGAGKSSTIKMLLGISRATSGTGRMLGRRIDDAKESREMRRHVAYVAEDKQTYAYMTVGEMMAFTRSFYEDWRPDLEQRLLAQYELPLNRKVKALSKGMRTKLALLLALARRPQLLILDEPTEGLDPVSTERLLQGLVTAAADGVAIFFSSHQIADVERIADRVCIIDRGMVVLETSLDHVRQDYRRIALGFAAEPPPWDVEDDTIRSVRTSGRQISVLATGNADAIVERAFGLGAVSVESTPVSLRELFLETVGESA
jgi:ABC-2 type transport system ATP-binding protein